MTTRWLFVGAGNMAASLAGGLIKADAPAGTITMIDPSAETRQRVEARFGVITSESFATLPGDGTQELSASLARAPSSNHEPHTVVYVIAVKPNIVEAACQAISIDIEERARMTITSGATKNENLIVSVAAGVRLDAMASWLPADMPIVRCMPNTPALLGLGASGLYANAACSADARLCAERLLDAAGSTHWVDDESLLDAVTALSGSGPAYFFYLIEQMAASGQKLGLDADTARELAIDTAFGAASMANAREVMPDELRRRVTSPGGTTAAALASFEEAELPRIVHEAMQAARSRAEELGDDFQP